jgi:DNA-binding response OmpR family regulator
MHSIAPAHILLVEDDHRLAQALQLALETARHRVTVAYTGDEAVTLAFREKPDLIVLDIYLPGLDGLEVCRQVRARTFVPILMITGARTEEQDRVVGLRFGADDYLVKPFGMAEFVARVEALLRRTTVYDVASNQTHEIRVGPLVIDREAYTVEVRGQKVELTPKEFDLLVALAERPGRVRTREYLLENVWGYSSGVQTRTLDMHIRRLREKLEEDPSHPKIIETVVGVGYKLVA